MSTEQDSARRSDDPAPAKSASAVGGAPPVLPRLPILAQLKQRNVFRVAVLYVVVCWLVLDPVHVVFHMLDVPVWANRLVLVLMAVGFPAVMIFAWVYEITPEGLKFTVEVPHGQSIRRSTGRRLDRAIIAVLSLALAYFIVDKFWISKRVSANNTAESTLTDTVPRADSSSASAFAPPPHSIAVLPFVNMSGDKEQEYFSDGLTEEILNSLARINELQVAARTSSFSFQGEHPDIATVAHKLNVGAVLEGSVRRSAHTVRITVQLVNAVTGFHVWSDTYDRNLGDVLKLETEIATAVASALKVSLLGDEAARIEVGGTENPTAFDAYLRGMRASIYLHDGKDLQRAIAAFSDAIALDPNYALAIAYRSIALNNYAGAFAMGVDDGKRSFDSAEADARRALALAPDLAEAHLALELYFENGALDFEHADKEYERALALTPGSARVLDGYSTFAVRIGRTDAGIAAARRAVVLDPLRPNSHMTLGLALWLAHRFREALGPMDDALTLDPNNSHNLGNRGLVQYALGDLGGARTSCEVKPADWVTEECLAIVYAKLGRQADAETQLAALRSSSGDSAAFQYAEIYAQWGQTSKALDWLETAFRLPDPGVIDMAVDPLVDPIRHEPRFQAIKQKLKYPM